jgi:putative toxin-antitoxin system antitoxin component (TIGR02293 family)
VETLEQVAPEVWEHAMDTFGSPEKAMVWMRTQLSELGDRTPEDVLLDVTADSNRVDDILTRIDFGVFV